MTVGGVTYNTLNNIVFSNSQPTLKSIKDNIGPRIGVAWQFLPKTVMRVGYGIFYDPISYRSQYAENTLQGSIWPWTRGVSDTLNSAPMGTAATPTVAPICNSLATCGPYGGYGTSSVTGLAGSNPIVVAPTPWGSTFGGYTNAPDYTDPRSQQWNFQIERQLRRDQHDLDRLRGQPHAAPGMVLQGQLSAGRPVLPEQPERRASRVRRRL